ncbi:MAG: glycosyltransferase involved in cell wall biosynthesis [Planctomycetota bacterium]|jgi:glycosyltransferase involved in cell wall biosynthesis
MEATIGGTRRHLVDVCAGQLARGLDVHLAVATSRDPDFSGDLEQLKSQGAVVHLLPMVREIRPLRDAADFRSLCRLLRETRPDIVHTHSSKAGVLGRCASIWTRIGTRVHTPHTFAFLFGALFGPAKRALFRNLEKTLSRWTSRVLAVSPTEAETFRASGVVPADRIRVVSNGIDPGRFETAAALDVATLGLDPAKPLAAVIGLVYAAKGQDLALDALTGEGCEDVQLLLVGPGELDQLREQVERNSLGSRVKILGARRDVPEILAAVDFLILPSRWEGMPYIVLEAMASRRPVVATPVDGALDLVADGVTGVLCATIDAPSLSLAIASMLGCSEAERQSMGQRGFDRLIATYTIDRMVEAMITIYREAHEAPEAKQAEGASL